MDLPTLQDPGLSLGSKRRCMSVEGKLRPVVLLWQRLGDGEAP